MQLGQPVHRVLEQVRAGMLEAIPAGVVGGVAEAEVRTLVDDRRAGGDEVWDELRRGPVREGEEDRIRGRQLRVDVEIKCREVSVDTADRIVVSPTSDKTDKLDVRMPRQEPHELAAHVAGRPDDPDPNDTRGRITCRYLPGNLGRRHRTYQYTHPVHIHATNASDAIEYSVPDELLDVRRVCPCRRAVLPA